MRPGTKHHLTILNSELKQIASAERKGVIVLTAHDVPMLFSKYVHNEVVGNFMFSYAEGDGRVKVKKKSLRALT